MKEYIIIYEWSYDKLEERVANAMEQGYKPSGSLVIRPPERTSDGQGIAEIAFIQPMVLKN